MLIRQSTSLPLQTLFMIGNGAMEHGDDPLQSAINTSHKHNPHLFKALDIGDSSALSCLCLHERQFFDLLILILKNAFGPTLPEHWFEDTLKNLHSIIIFFRNTLSQHYKTPKDPIKFKNMFLPHLNQHGLFQETSGCITTNWDETIWNNKEIHNVIYLHGRASIPSSMILPTESMVERGLKWHLLSEVLEKLNEFAHKKNLISQAHEVVEHYRLDSSLALNTQLFEAENVLYNWSQKATKLVIAGVRFNDYDHELMTLSLRSLNSNITRIYMINRANTKEEMDKKKSRIAGLFSRPFDHIHFINTTPIKQ